LPVSGASSSRIWCGQRRALLQQRRPRQARPGEAVGLDGEGGQNKGVGTFRPQERNGLGQAFPAALGLKEEVGNALVQKQAAQADVLRRHVHPLVGGHGADVGKDKGVLGCGGLVRQLAPGSHHPRQQVLVPEGRQVGAEGVGLEGAAPGVQIVPVNFPDDVRVLQIGQLTAGGGQLRPLGEQGPHGPVEQQHMVL
jgi:hypothetical protein